MRFIRLQPPVPGDHWLLRAIDVVAVVVVATGIGGAAGYLIAGAVFFFSR